MGTLTHRRAAATPREQILPVGPDTWRLVAPNGRVIGNVVARASDRGTRYDARRYHVPTATHLEVGSFWRMEDACNALRWL